MKLGKLRKRARNAALVAGILAVSATASAKQPMEDIRLDGIRGMRFCEFLLVYDHGVDIYNTSASDGCPEDKWSALDTAAIAAEHGAKAAQLNGPKFWAPDSQTFLLGETKSFGGIEARYGATLPLSALGADKGSDAYVPFTSSKKQTLVFKAGQPVYQLVDPEGYAYALNAYGNTVTSGDPADLSGQLSVPEGWSFRVLVPEEDLIAAPPKDGPTNMVGDDLHQYYTRIETK